MIVSDGHVWPAFVARCKTVTRRNWKPETAARFRRGYLFDKFDKGPFAGGKLIGRCRMLEDAYQQPLAEMPDSEWYDEGFAWLHDHPWTIPQAARREAWAQGDCSFAAFNSWRQGGGVVWVARYVIVSVEQSAIDRLDALLQAKPVTLF